jgi:hypothetical protein
MEPLEEYTLVIGLLAIAIAEISWLTQYIREKLHH